MRLETGGTGVGLKPRPIEGVVPPNEFGRPLE